MAVGMATHVVISTVISHHESATYTIVYVLLTLGADEHNKGTPNKKNLSTWSPNHQS